MQTGPKVIGEVADAITYRMVMDYHNSITMPEEQDIETSFSLSLQRTDIFASIH
jgi:hypothetical protein